MSDVREVKGYRLPFRADVTEIRFLRRAP